MLRPTKFHRAAAGMPLLPAVLVLVMGVLADADELSPPLSETPLATSDASELAARIQRLIRQLGSPEFVQRRRAEQALGRIGIDTFDQLKVAENDEDLEIAERAKYLLARLLIQWQRDDDPASVRHLLAGYGDLAEGERRQRITALAALDADRGVGALCRIARFEPSSHLSRFAAVAILGAAGERNGKHGELASKIAAEVGVSQRVAAKWLRAFTLELDDPAAALPKWQVLIDEELRRLDASSDGADTRTALNLLRHHLRLLHRLGRNDQALEAMIRQVELSPDYAEFALASLVDWLSTVEDWQLLDRLRQQFQDRIEMSPSLTYALAAAYVKQGREGEGEALAEQAFQIPRSDDTERVAEAALLHQRGRIDWALREYQHVIRTLPVLGMDSWLSSFEARQSVAQVYHDRLQHQSAAELLEPFVEASKNSRDKQVAYARRIAGTRMQYYLACDAESNGEPQKQREYLDRAMTYSEEDADVLIARYRLPGVDEKYQQQTRDDIRRVSAEFQRRINQFPDSPSYYNQWAWLVSNTEGDFEKAIRYSQKSLELRPGEASYLDTLGRCYFAAGQLEKAIEVQRQAVAADPHMNVMRRQLKMFETSSAAAKDQARSE